MTSSNYSSKVQDWTGNRHLRYLDTDKTLPLNYLFILAVTCLERDLASVFSPPITTSRVLVKGSYTFHTGSEAKREKREQVEGISGGLGGAYWWGRCQSFIKLHSSLCLKKISHNTLPPSPPPRRHLISDCLQAFKAAMCGIFKHRRRNSEALMFFL